MVSNLYQRPAQQSLLDLKQYSCLSFILFGPETPEFLTGVDLQVRGRARLLRPFW